MRLKTAILAVAIGSVAGVLGAAPVSPSYLGVERTIDEIRRSWSSPGAPAQPNAPGWDALFDALLADLGSYSKAESEGERLEALNRVYQISTGLSTVASGAGGQPPRGDPPMAPTSGPPRLGRQRLSETVQALAGNHRPEYPRQSIALGGLRSG